MNSGLLTRTLSTDRAEYKYQIYMPSKLKEEENLPIMLFLHGINQRGSGGYLSSSGIAGMFLKKYLEQVPSIVLLPQCPKDRYWWDQEIEEMVIGTLDQTIEEFKADKKRIYLIGVSMGGYGAWHLIATHAERFASVVSICGGSPYKTSDRNSLIAERAGSIPAWLFHGSEDKVVPVGESREIVDALKARGSNVRYNEYKGAGHNIWFNVATENDLLPWILDQRRD
jgi:predicted peptidase